MIINGKNIVLWCPACNIEVHGHTGYATLDGKIFCTCKTEVVAKEWLDKQHRKLSYKIGQLWKQFLIR